MATLHKVSLLLQVKLCTEFFSKILKIILFVYCPISIHLISRNNTKHDNFHPKLHSKIAAMTNQQRQAHETSVSAKDKRKQRKELESARREYESKMALLAAEEEGDAGKASVSHMVLPDYRSGRNEKDIWVRNVSLSLDNGKSLLDDGELKFSHQRRYGLVGKNGECAKGRASLGISLKECFL